MVLTVCVLTAAAAFPTVSARAAGGPVTVPRTDFLSSPTANAQAQLAADNIGSDASASAAYAAADHPAIQRPVLAGALGSSALDARDSGQAALVGPQLAGMAATHDGLQVSLAGPPTAALSAAVSQLAGPNVPVRVRWVKNSQATLDAVTAQVTEDRAYWTAQGLTLSTWGPDYTSNAVSVSFTTDLTPAQTQLVHDRYTGLVTVQTGSDPLAHRTSRTDDSSPFFGGDETTDHTSHTICTSGFTLFKKGVSYATTAGHCAGGTGTGAVNHTYYNGNHVNVAHSMGKVIARSFVNKGDLDYEVLSGHGTQSVWGGTAIQTPWIRYVTSAASTDLVNGLICTSGADTKEVCSVKIHSPSICKEFTDAQTTCGLVSASRTAVTVSQEGDSGGPVETTLGHDETEARGMIIGGNDLNQIVYYTPIRFITRAFSASVVS